MRTLAAFAARHLREVVSGIHLLPFYPWSSDDGFSVKDYFAVEPAYGTWADLGRFRPEFDLMFDAVFNHLSAQSEWFQRFLRDDPAFRDFFIMVTGDPDLSQVIRPRALPLLTEVPTAAGPRKVWTTFSADQVDLNFQNPEVLLATLAALLLYVRNGARFIRLDAIAFLWKEIGTSCLHRPQTHRLVQLMRTVLDRVAPGVRLITETNVPHTDNLSYFGDGTNEAHLVYNFALPPLVLHAMQTGNAVPLTRWAQTLALPSPQVTFFNFLASHDGVGLNPARGILSDAEIDALVARTLAHGGLISYKNMPDGSRLPYEMNINYLDALESGGNEPTELAARKFLTAQAVLLSLQGVPGIYFHSLFGLASRAYASGIARRINRETEPRPAGNRTGRASPLAPKSSAVSRATEVPPCPRSFCPSITSTRVVPDPRIRNPAETPDGTTACSVCTMSAAKRWTVRCRRCPEARTPQSPDQARLDGWQRTRHPPLNKLPPGQFTRREAGCRYLRGPRIGWCKPRLAKS